MNRLANKTAIITGAAGGIGKGIALLFVKEGAKVLATDIQEEKLRSWVEEARKEGLSIDFQVHNVASEADWSKVTEKANGLYGGIDILVNNAGIYPPGATTMSTTAEDWNRVFSINVTGPFIGSRLCIPFFRKRGKGAIVNISSIAGIVGGNGPAYTASKGALRLLTKDQAVEFAKDNIRVNSIHPGGVLTPMTDFMTNMQGADELIKNSCPMGRMAGVEEIAYAALYLASDEASFTTGAELAVDGGLIAR